MKITVYLKSYAITISQLDKLTNNNEACQKDHVSVINVTLVISHYHGIIKV